MDWGLIVYEQDWESTSADEVPLLTNTTNFGRTWLTQMGRSADKHDLSIQCLATTFIYSLFHSIINNNIHFQYTQIVWILPDI